MSDGLSARKGFKLGEDPNQPIEDTWNAATRTFVRQIQLIYMRSYVWGDALKSFTNNAAEVFCGGHVRCTGDGGMLYDRWLQDPGLKRGERQTSSSHQSDYAQYEVIVPGRGVILVGCSNKYRTINNRHTWFQNEAHAATEGFVELTLHGADFFRHKASGNQQVGALGYSPYSEKEGSNPLVCEGQLPLVIIRLTQT